MMNPYILLVTHLCGRLVRMTPYDALSTEDDRRDIPSSLYLARAAGKPTGKFDLEAPADDTEEEENNTFPMVEIANVDHPITPIDVSQEKISSDAMCMRLALKLPLMMDWMTSTPWRGSSMNSRQMNTVANHVSRESQWMRSPWPHCFFPGVVGATQEQGGGKETCRQILPALADDLEALGAMIRAGESWQISSTGRSTSPNMPSSESRGTRRPRSLAVAVAEAPENSPQIQSTSY
ncbi:hypothetical protein BHM03_00018953 [Ensete ventricosum]|nr:hypothetical protein BHM03_00018953 [Ensete ventricosum]